MEKYSKEKALVDDCLSLKPAAQRFLYDQHVQAMYNTVYRYTFDHHDTQDILQEAFTRVFKHLKNFNPEKGRLRSWMRKIHVRCTLDFLKKKRQVSIEELDEVLIPLSASEIDATWEVDHLLKIIASLDTRERIIFNMYHIEGYKHEEIAEMLSINVNSCRVYLARAKKVLQKRVLDGQKQLEFIG